MPYTYILDDSIKSPTLILTADHSTLLFLPGFYKIKNFLFLLWVNLYMICMTLPLWTAHFSWPLPFLPSQKVVLWPSLCFWGCTRIFSFLAACVRLKNHLSQTNYRWYLQLIYFYVWLAFSLQLSENNSQIRQMFTIFRVWQTFKHYLTTEAVEPQPQQIFFHRPSLLLQVYR